MTDQLTANEKTPRGNGRKHSAETATIDLAAGAGLTLLTSESPAPMPR
jgi:hypothetical protein